MSHYREKGDGHIEGPTMWSSLTLQREENLKTVKLSLVFNKHCSTQS